MGNDINQVIVIARMVANAELKYTNSGTPLSKFSVAVNRRIKQGDQWTEEASFFTVVLWGKQAEAINQYLTKGKQIGIIGQLKQNRWEKDGHKRSRVEIVADNIQLLGGRSDGEAKQAPPQQPQKSNDDQNSFPDDFVDDDIPF